MAHGGVRSWVDVQYAGTHRAKSGYMYSTVRYVRMHDCTVRAAGKDLLENCVLRTHISVNGMHASSRVTEFLLWISDFMVVYIVQYKDAGWLPWSFSVGRNLKIAPASAPIPCCAEC